MIPALPDRVPLERAPPADLNAERATLGALLLERDAIIVVAPWLAADDFYLEKHAWIYEAVCACADQRIPPDIATVADELRRRERLERVGGIAYLGQLTAEMPIAVHVEHYGRIVARTALLRRLIQTGGQIAALGYDERDDVATTLDRAEQALFAVTQCQRGQGFRPLREVVASFYEQVQAGDDPLLPTGFADLDRTLGGGLHPGDLVVLAARPGVGKTSLALSLAYQVALHAQRHAAIVSLEMSDARLLNRLLAMHTAQNSRLIRQRIQAGDQPLIHALGVLSNTSIWIDDRPGLTVLDVRSHARRLRAAGSLDLLIVDYLQLLTDDTQQRNRVEEVTRISRQLKLLAKELAIPVIALAQLNRAVEGRVSKVPILADLRDSGAVEQDADIVLFIYREELYDKDSAKRGLAELHIAKHREGALGTVPLRFDAATTRFRDLHDPPQRTEPIAAHNGHCRNGHHLELD